MVPRAEFEPYRSWYFCRSSREEAVLWPPRGLWEYDVRYQNTYIEMSGAPEAPLDLGLRIELGAAMGRPGDVVRVVESSGTATSFVAHGPEFRMPYDLRLDAPSTFARVEAETPDGRAKILSNPIYVM